MKTPIAILTLVFATAGRGMEPTAPAILTEVRSIVAAPDQWADMTAEIQALDSLAKRCEGRKKDAIQDFQRSLASYRGYFSDHPFSLSVDERAALSEAIQVYEEHFAREQRRILASWRDHPNQDRGCLAAGEIARSAADFDLEKCGPVFAAHGQKKSRPNELAGVFIKVMREYGRLLSGLSEEPNQTLQPTPAAGRG